MSVNFHKRIDDDLESGNAIIVISVSRTGGLTLASNIGNAKFLQTILKICNNHSDQLVGLPDEVLPVSDDPEAIRLADEARARHDKERNEQEDAARYIFAAPEKLQ